MLEKKKDFQEILSCFSLFSYRLFAHFIKITMLLICSLSRNLICHNFRGNALYFSKQTVCNPKIKKKTFAQIYRALFGDTVLVPSLCPSRWAPTCQTQTNKKHLSLSFASKAWIHLSRKFPQQGVTDATQILLSSFVCILLMSIYILFVKWLLNNCIC